MEIWEETCLLILHDECGNLYLYTRELFLHAIELTPAMADSIIEYSAPSGRAPPYMNRRIMSLGIYGKMNMNYYSLRISKDAVVSRPAEGGKGRNEVESL
jgi:hypothetical protein